MTLTTWQVPRLTLRSRVRTIFMVDAIVVRIVACVGLTNSFVVMIISVSAMTSTLLSLTISMVSVVRYFRVTFSLVYWHLGVALLIPGVFHALVGLFENTVYWLVCPTTVGGRR